MKVWALTKTTHGTHADDTYTKILGVYRDWDDLVARLERIREANKQYAMTETSPKTWRIGPDEDEDEGFFGNKPVFLAAQETDYHE